MPRYLLLLHGDESAEDRLTDDEKRSIVEAHLALIQELSAAGKLVASEALTHSRRARTVRGRSVPDVLKSGDHAAIQRWRAAEAGRRTRSRRPDLRPHPSDRVLTDLTEEP